jgi:hypothetical protein
MHFSALDCQDAHKSVTDPALVIACSSPPSPLPLHQAHQLTPPTHIHTQYIGAGRRARGVRGRDQAGAEGGGDGRPRHVPAEAPGPLLGALRCVCICVCVWSGDCCRSHTHTHTQPNVEPLSVDRSMDSFIHPSIHSFIHSFTLSSIHSSIHPFIHPSIHSFIHVSANTKTPADDNPSQPIHRSHPCSCGTYQHTQVDFGDFDFFRLEEIKAVRYNGGFARFGALEPEGTCVPCVYAF